MAESMISDANKQCKRNLEDVAVSSDLPRLARKFRWVKDGEGINQELEELCNKVVDEEEHREQVKKEIVLYVLQRIARDFGQDAPEKENFLNTVNFNNSVSLNEFLTKQFGEDGPVTRVLKLCHQGVIVHGIMYLQLALRSAGLSFRDARGFWHILVNTTRPSITHRRREEIYDSSKRFHDASDSSIMQIEWEYEVIFDSPELQHVSDVQMRLTKCLFDKSPLSNDCVERVQQCLEELFTDIPSKLSRLVPTPKSKPASCSPNNTSHRNSSQNTVASGGSQLSWSRKIGALSLFVLAGAAVLGYAVSERKWISGSDHP